MTEAKTQKKPVDLSSMDEAVKRQDQGIDVPINGMDGKSLGFTIKVAGPDSERAIKAQEELADELIEAGNNERLKAREAARRGVRYLAKITMGWDPAVVVDGKELAYSEENAEKLYTRFRFIREQVDRAAGNRKAFTKG